MGNTSVTDFDEARTADVMDWIRGLLLVNQARGLHIFNEEARQNSFIHLVTNANINMNTPPRKPPIEKPDSLIGSSRRSFCTFVELRVENKRSGDCCERLKVYLFHSSHDLYTPLQLL